MKDKIRKVYPILLPPMVLIAGILGVIFFFCGPVAQWNYDILIIGLIAIVLGVIAISFLIAEAIKERKHK